MSKLDWAQYPYADEQRASYKGLLIRALPDASPENPFEAQDGHWPMATLVDRDLKVCTGTENLFNPLYRFTPEALVFNQVALAKLMGFADVAILLDCYGTIDPVKYTQDREELQWVFDQALGDIDHPKERLDIFEKMYEMLGIPLLRTTSRGYSQGDEADLLIVATPEAVAEIYGENYFAELETNEISELHGKFRVGSGDIQSAWHEELDAARAEFDQLVKAQITKSFDAQADLYSAWAWGDVYGYIVEDDEGDEIDSCWGFYGTDHDKSGLEEAALCGAKAHLNRVRNVLPKNAGVTACLI